MYLSAVMDWYSRYILSWELSNSLEINFCVLALKRALAHYGDPEIFNTDQGSQFTSADWVNALASRGIKISMDGKGQWIDNVFIKRLWRSMKYECIYLNAFDSFADANAGIDWWMTYYNKERPHSSLSDNKTPAEVYLELAA